MAASRKSRSGSFPSDGEVDILAALWRIGPATVREIHEELRKNNGYTTTLKQIQVMTGKGLLTRSERFGMHVYEPGIPQAQTQTQIAGSLMKRVFGGSAERLVMGALSAQPVSPKEIAGIRRMLDEFEKRKGGKQ